MEIVRKYDTYVLDKIFGTKNFRNTIIWHYYNKYSAGKKCLPRAYDNIFYYGKSELHNPNELRDKREEPVKQLLRENINGVLKNKILKCTWKKNTFLKYSWKY